MAPTRPANPTRNRSTINQSFKVTKPEKKYRGKQVFKGKEVALSGSFTKAGKPQTHEKIGNYVTSHGGDYVAEVGPDTTHLICTIEDFKNKSPNVKKALDRNRGRGRKCEIVTFDWIQECLTRLQKRLADPAEFRLKETLKKLKERAEYEGKKRKNFKNEQYFERDRVTDLGKDLHRVYYDVLAFEYKVELMRSETSGGKTRVQRYTLFLFQSLAIPPHFLTAAQLNETIITPPPSTPHPSILPAKATKAYRPISYFRDYCQPKEFHNAFSDFKHFFHDKTGLGWDDRFEYSIKGKFEYVVPAVNKPVGLLPPGRKSRARYPSLTVEEVEESQGAETQGDGAGEITGRQTPQSYEGKKGIEMTVASRTKVSDTLSRTLRGDGSEASEKTRGGAVDPAATDSFRGEVDEVEIIAISDDESEDFENPEDFDDMLGIENNVVEGLMRDD